MNDAVEASFRPGGRVTFDNLLRIRQEGEAAIAAAPGEAVVDLSGLENGNSAAVALLMAWLRAARDLDKPIVFTRVPTGIRNIVELSGMNDVLPLQDDGAQQ